MAAIIRHIVEQHAEEAAFLWLLRDKAVDAPHYTRDDLARLDERVEAHLDGLRVAGEDGWAIMRAEMAAHPEMGEVFAAGVLALESHDPARVDAVIDVTEFAPDTTRGFISALGWVDAETLRGTVSTLLHDPSAHRRMLGVAACSVQRVDPGPMLATFLKDEPVVRARALRLVGELGRADLAPAIRAALRDENETCRFWAAWSAGLIGERQAAIPILQAHAVGDGPFKWKALDLVLRIMEHKAAIRWLGKLDQGPAHHRLTTIGAGVIGDPVFVPWLIERMDDPALARVAGEAFSMITGVDLAYEDLDGDALEDRYAETHDKEMQNLEADENLPFPDPEQVRIWWDERRARYSQGQRYILGSAEPLRSAKNAQFQRQRRVFAAELALMQICAELENGCRARCVWM